MPDISKTIGGLALIKVVVRGASELENVLDDAIAILKGIEPGKTEDGKCPGCGYDLICGREMTGEQVCCPVCGKHIQWK